MAAEEDGLTPGEDREHDMVFLMGVGPLGIPEGGAPDQIVSDVAAGDLGMRGDDDKSFSAIQGFDHIVYQH